jgi:hypothetical protein
MELFFTDSGLFRLQPELDQAADGFGAARFVDFTASHSAALLAAAR